MLEEPIPGTNCEMACDKCHCHDSRSSEFFGLCGCGSSDELELLAVEVLTAAARGTLREWIGENLEREFVVHALGDHGLLEHGVSIFGSWLTDLGKAVLESYKQFPKKSDDWYEGKR